MRATPLDTMKPASGQMKRPQRLFQQTTSGYVEGTHAVEIAMKQVSVGGHPGVALAAALTSTGLDDSRPDGLGGFTLGPSDKLGGRHRGHGHHEVKTVSQRAREASCISFNLERAASTLPVGVSREPTGASPRCLFTMSPSEDRNLKPLSIHGIRRPSESICARNGWIRGYVRRMLPPSSGSRRTPITNWEMGHTEPHAHSIPAIHRFLSCVPSVGGRAEQTTAERLKERRRALGWSQRMAAWHLRIDPTTLAKWERAERVPRGRFANLVRNWLTPASRSATF